jgi:hypothetical protein
MRYAARMDHSVWMLRICMFRRILMWPRVSKPPIVRSLGWTSLCQHSTKESTCGDMEAASRPRLS